MTGAHPPLAAAVQLCSTPDPATNLAMIDAALARAADTGAVMAFLPEMAVLLDRDRGRAARWWSSEAASPWPDAFAAMAARHHLWLHAGSAPFLSDDPGAEPGRLVNRSLLFDAGGALKARYDKIHLFDVDLPSGESWRESGLFDGGAALVIADTPLGRLGLSICYDLRFGELFRALAAAGADVLAVPAAFTVPTGRAHWQVLLRARAIETGCHVIAAAQGGRHGDGRATYGHSLIADPQGAVLTGADGDAPTEIIAAIDPAAAASARAAIPLAQSRHRRGWPPG